MVRWDFPNVEIAVKNEICFNFIIRIIEENLTGRTSFFLFANTNLLLSSEG